MDEAKVFKEDAKSSDWISAEYDASPKAGQTFFSQQSANSPPIVENVTTTPASPVAGDDVNVSGDVVDPDGDPIAWAGASVWVNGTKTVDNRTFNSTSGGTYEWINLVTDAKPSTDYNISIEASDGTNIGSNTINFTLKQDPPDPDILEPVNGSTLFTYDPAYRMRVTDDGDSVPNEIVTCDLYNATNANYTGLSPFRTVTARENDTQADRTFSGNLRVPTGTHEFMTSCVDGDEINRTVNYTVDRYELQSNATMAEAYEAAETLYNFTATIGDMVDRINVSLYWNGTLRNSTIVTGNSQVRNVTDQLLFQPPLVEANVTAEDWNFESTYNFTFENETNGETTEQETSGTQNVWWAYFFDNETVLDPDTYFEGEDYNHEFNITIKNSNSNFDAETIYNRTGSRATASNGINLAQEVASFTGSQNVGTITSASDTFNVSGLVNISFRNRERSIFVEERELTVNRILLTDCSGGSASQTVTLQFNTWNESNTTSAVDSDLDMAIEVWNPDNPSFVRTYNFSSENASTHEFCISPTDATYTASTVDKLIQYEGAAGKYPKRSYFIINETLSNTTTTIPLYLLIDNLASAIGIEVENPDGQPYSDLIIRIDRYFPGLDKHITVAMSRTGSQGLTETFLETNEIYYQFTMYDEMEEVAFFPNQVVPPDNDFFFRIGADAEPGFFEYIDSVSILDGDGDGEPCVQDATTFNCTYSSTTESLDNITLTVEEVEKIGTTSICSVSGQTSSGTLHCTGLNTTANEYVYSIEADFGDTVLTVVSGSFGAVSDLFGTGGVFIAFGIIVTAGMAGLLLQSGAAVVLFTVAGLMVSYWTNFLVMPREAIISIVAVAALLIWRMSR